MKRPYFNPFGIKLKVETPPRKTADSKKTTVILINPQHHRNWDYQNSQFSFPIGLMYLSAALKNAGFNPVIIDACTQADHEVLIGRLLPETLYAGISAMTPQVPHAYHLAGIIRRFSQNLPIVWGGIHPSLYPESCNDPLCSVAVIGEGDRTSVELALAFLEKKDLSQIHGIAYIKDHAVTRTPDRIPLDVNSLPAIDYDGVDFERYVTTYLLQENRRARVIPVHAARGCPWHCTFCINTTLNAERRYRCRNATVLLEEIQNLSQKYDIEGIMLQDEEFFANRERIVGFLDGVESRNLGRLKFFATSRVNHFREGYIDRPFLERLKKCGFVDFVFGVESGSRHCLEIIQKEISIEQVLHTARLLAGQDLQAAWGFIMAIPGESRKDIIKTLHVMEKIRKISSKNYFIGPQIFRPYPGSVLYQEALKAGLREPSTLKQWTEQTFNAEGWSRDLPWVEQKSKPLVEYINTVSPICFNSQFLNSKGLKRVYHALIRMMFRMRLAFDFWGIPLEHRLKRLKASPQIH